jgi:hypothetical protein
MSNPRNLYPDTTLLVTCRCVHESYRLVPTKTVRRVVAFCFAKASTEFREKWGMKFYEFEFLSTHYHFLTDNGRGRISDFLQHLNSLIARELNAVRGKSGAFFDDSPGIQTILGDERIFEHCVYTLANAVAAGIVRETRRWKGFNSLKLEYGVESVIEKPRVGLWSRRATHKNRRGSRRSGRAAYAGRSKMPDKAILKLDRPPIMQELSDGELRREIRRRLLEREQEIAAERGGRPVLGMRAAEKIHWSTVPTAGEELFGLQPTFSTETKAQRRQMKILRKRFLREYREALERWNKGERDVVFPSGTVRMRVRHNARTEPIPLDLLLTA